MNFYLELEKQKIPSYMMDESTFGYFQTSGQMKDDINSAAIDAIQDSFIQSAPSDALSSLGNNYNIDRAPPLTDTQYKNKLAVHWDFWRTSGTPARLIKEIQDYGFPNTVIVPEYTETVPGNWVKTFPSITDQFPPMDVPYDPYGIPWWSNFWVVIRLPHTFKARLWGSPEAGKWGTGGTDGPYKWGSIAGDQGTLAALVALIKKLKPAWSSCRGIIFGFANFPAWGSFNWGDGTLWGLPTGSYGVYYIQEEWEL